MKRILMIAVFLFAAGCDYSQQNDKRSDEQLRVLTEKLDKQVERNDELLRRNEKVVERWEKVLSAMEKQYKVE